MGAGILGNCMYNPSLLSILRKYWAVSQPVSQGEGPDGGLLTKPIDTEIMPYSSL